MATRSPLSSPEYPPRRRPVSCTSWKRRPSRAVRADSPGRPGVSFASASTTSPPAPPSGPLTGPSPRPAAERSVPANGEWLECRPFTIHRDQPTTSYRPTTTTEIPMWIHNFFKPCSVRRPTRRPTSRPCLETLEDRCLLSFSPAVSYAAGASPQDMVTADFNADDRLDLAVSNSGANTVSVLLGNGDGTFQAALTSGTGAGPESLLVAELNGDGKTDLVTVNNYYGVGDSRLSVLLGNGDGTFVPPQSIVLPYTTTGYQTLSSAKLGDLNADGKLDLVAVGGTTIVIVISDDPTDLMYEYHTDGYVNVFLGNGNGTFGHS